MGTISMGRWLAGAALCIASASWSDGATAQARGGVQDTLSPRRPAADTARRLPAIEIVGSVVPLAGAVAGSLAPARVIAVEARDLARWAPRLVAGALASRPGLSLYDDVGSAYKPTLLTRGFAASPVVGLPQGISVFVDGVPVNEPDAGQVNFDLLPLAHLQRVELLRGTNALLGPNSLGGVVNLVTRRGEGKPRGEVSLSAGSFGRESVGGNGGGVTRGWSWYAGAHGERERGWRQRTGARLADGFVQAGRFGERHGIGVQAFAAHSRVHTAGSLPASVHASRPDSNLSSGDVEDLRQLHVAATAYAPLAGGSGTLRAFVRRHQAERFNANQPGDPDVRGFARNRTLGASADWRVLRPAGRGVLGARVGAGAQANHAAIRLLAERIDPGLTTFVESPIRKADVFALADYHAGRVSVTGGARYDVVQIPFRNRLDPAKDTTSTFRRLSPRAGIRVALSPSAGLYASVGESFRAPAVIELACADPEEPCPLPFALGDDPPLAPVVAATAEVGGEWERGGLSLDASAYVTRVRNDIFLFPYEEEGEPQNSTIDGYFANVSRTRRAGVELGARAALPRGVTLHAEYAYTRATFQTRAEIFSVREAEGGENLAEPGDQLPLVPAHGASAGIAVQLPASIELAAEGRYTGRRWLRGDEANETAPLPAVTVADASAGFARGGWAVRAIVRNVLGRRYASFGTFNINQGNGGTLERFLTPGDRRSLEIVLRRTIGRSD